MIIENHRVSARAHGLPVACTVSIGTSTLAGLLNIT